MSEGQSQPSGPDLAQASPVAQLADGAMLLGHVGDEAVLLARRGDEFFAVGATCTHYGGPLAEGLLVGDTVRCPWHHACFSLRTGEALRRAGAQPGRLLARRAAGRHGLRAREAAQQRRRRAPLPRARRAGIDRHRRRRRRRHAAAEMLRREGYAGAHHDARAPTTRAPFDRPNLSKDYLAGNAPEDWIRCAAPTSTGSTHRSAARRARRRRSTPARRRSRSRTAAASPTTRCCSRPAPSRCGSPFPARDLPHVHYSAHARRQPRDHRRRPTAPSARSSSARASSASRSRPRCARASSRSTSSAPETAPAGARPRPRDRRLRPRAPRGARRHLPPRTTTAASIDETQRHAEERRHARRRPRGRRRRRPPAHWRSPSRPGLAIDRGVTVDEYLETSAPGIFAAGDIARWPDPHTGETIRVEHWVVAERQGQTAARNMLGRAAAVRRRAVLLEPALRRRDRLRRPRRAVGRRSRSTAARRRDCRVDCRRGGRAPRRRDDRPRCGEPARRARARGTIGR